MYYGVGPRVVSSLASDPCFVCPFPKRLIHDGSSCAELLLVLWGVLFVAVRAEEPRLMRRDFKDTGVRAVQSVRDVAVGLGRVATSTMTRRTDSMSVPGENAEAIPAWDREGHSNAQVNKRELSLLVSYSFPTRGLRIYCMVISSVSTSILRVRFYQQRTSVPATQRPQGDTNFAPKGQRVKEKVKGNARRARRMGAWTKGAD